MEKNIYDTATPFNLSKKQNKTTMILSEAVKFIETKKERKKK